MRIRCKPWARPELEQSPFFIREPKEKRGHWAEEFGNGKPIWLELGCGKGGFASQAVVHWQDVNFIAVDIKNEMLVLAKRKIEAALKENGLTDEQVRVMIFNISHIEEAFAPEDRIDRIFINFCNPWPKGKHKKRRLTHPRQLVQYKPFLRGEIWFGLRGDISHPRPAQLRLRRESRHRARADVHRGGQADQVPDRTPGLRREPGVNDAGVRNR